MLHEKSRFMRGGELMLYDHIFCDDDEEEDEDSDDDEW
jgi:hypothetical protein